jgi:uncharacterized membrane protein
MLALFHPACVHFPIVLLTLGGLWEAWGQFTARESAIRGGGLLTLLGTLSVLPTLVTGYLAANSVAIPAEARTVFDRHELNGWLVLGVFVLLLFWKAWHRGVVPESQRKPYALLQLVGVGLVVVSAVLGGELVYTHGVGTSKGRLGSVAGEDRFQRVACDLGVLAKPPDRVRVPVLTVRDVDP